MQRFSPKPLLPAGFLASVSEVDRAVRLRALPSKHMLSGFHSEHLAVTQGHGPLHTPRGTPNLHLVTFVLTPSKQALRFIFVWDYRQGFLAGPQLTPYADMHGFVTGVLTVWRRRTTSRLAVTMPFYLDMETSVWSRHHYPLSDGRIEAEKIRTCLRSHKF